MTHIASPSTVIRTSRGLTIRGTRLTLYTILDFVHAGWPEKLIRDRLHLTEEQLTDALHYIATHREEVITEYATVLHEAAEIQQYWETQYQQRLTTIAAQSRSEHAALRGKLAAAKAKLPTV